MLVRTMHPSNEQRADLGALQRKKKHFAPTAGAHCAILPKLCTEIELVEAIRKVASIFFIQRIVFHTGYTKKFGLIE